MFHTDADYIMSRKIWRLRLPAMWQRKSAERAQGWAVHAAGLFIAQGYHGIDLGRALCREERRHKRDDQQHGGHRNQR